MDPKLANARKLVLAKEEGGKQVHAVRIVGSSTGALTLLAAGQVDCFQ
jgi:fructose-1,6-bisphosphatase/inositol monophosphatase family enzyme